MQTHSYMGHQLLTLPNSNAYKTLWLNLSPITFIFHHTWHYIVFTGFQLNGELSSKSQSSPISFFILAPLRTYLLSSMHTFCPDLFVLETKTSSTFLMCPVSSAHELSELRLHLFGIKSLLTFVMLLHFLPSAASLKLISSLSLTSHLATHRHRASDSRQCLDHGVLLSRKCV